MRNPPTLCQPHLRHSHPRIRLQLQLVRMFLFSLHRGRQGAEECAHNSRNTHKKHTHIKNTSTRALAPNVMRKYLCEKKEEKQHSRRTGGRFSSQPHGACCQTKWLDAFCGSSITPRCESRGVVVGECAVFLSKVRWPPQTHTQRIKPYT